MRGAGGAAQLPSGKEVAAMYFRQIADRSDGALTYVLGNLAAQEAVVIDPAPRQSAVVQALLAERKLALRWILYTQDHDGGGDAAMPTLAGAHAAAIARAECSASAMATP